jgi:crotonobetainyl-CoA:carnitine CoA-transferase CaiB-like acyl-CoA transferase
MYSAMGILGALFAREKTGQGQFLDMALFDSQLTWLANVGSSYLNANTEPRRWGNAHPNIVPYQVFRGSDGKYFVVAIGTERLWKKFMEVLQSQSTIGVDSRFVTNALRIEHRSELVAILQKRFDSEARNTWLERFANASIPAAPINAVPEALRDAQALARGLIIQIEHPALREVRGIANPVRFSDLPVSYRLPPPMLGEHTEEILRAYAG